MIHGKRLIVVLPALNAARTLARTVEEIPPDVVDGLVLVDDGSTDETVAISRGLGVQTIVHDANRGYGANQKTCYRAALELGADVVVMLHPDYQYSPLLVPAMASMVACGQYDLVLGSRVLGIGALKGGMPLYKYVSNRVLTFAENILLDLKLSEYHTGYRAFSRELLEALPLDRNSDDFVFDNQVLAQTAYLDFRIGELSCPARYEPESSSINFTRSTQYGVGVLGTALRFRLARLGLKSGIFT
ncbi:MAG: glycosyltransferase family 2 protein [Proteobacteria bacterium]|nr:glycosyltransferase family 2 protein [Pseudomonadota bacterium]MCP4917416.1 glycosyltransferase family 2 protein [Pseudomonadota bacterium]